MHRKLRRVAVRAALIALQYPRVLKYRLLSNNRPSNAPTLRQPLQCLGLGTIDLEQGVHIGVFPSPGFTSTYSYIEARYPSAAVRIGAGTQINNNFCAIAEHTSISIGRDCLIGSNVEVIDSDFHGLDPEQRGLSIPEWARPVCIGRNVFIGSHSKILKGVTIGDDSVIAAGSVVSSDVPSRSLVGGNPARVIKSL